MAKLSIEFLEAKIAEANEKGVHKFDLMTNEELAAYKENCLEAIDRNRSNIARNKYKGGSMQRIWAETIEVLEGYIAYIDAKLGEQVEVVEEKPVVTITDMKSKGTKYEITYKGQTVSRTTKREYAYVVIANCYTYAQSGKLSELGFCGRHDLAVKKYEEYRKNNMKVSTFYDDDAYRKPGNYPEIKDKKLWENLQIVELV